MIRESIAAASIGAKMFHHETNWGDVMFHRETTRRHTPNTIMISTAPISSGSHTAVLLAVGGVAGCTAGVGEAGGCAVGAAVGETPLTVAGGNGVLVRVGDGEGVGGTAVAEGANPGMVGAGAAASATRNQPAVLSVRKNAHNISATFWLPRRDGWVQSLAISSASQTRPSLRAFSPSIHK